MINHIHFHIQKLKKQGYIRRIIVWTAVTSFVFHIFLITQKTNTRDIFEKETLQQYLVTISTPFTIFLFYEILQMILALPKSLVRSMGKQYEIITLIILNETFKQLSTMGLSLNGSNKFVLFSEILLLLGGSLIMFTLTALYYRVSDSISIYLNKQPTFYSQTKKIMTLAILGLYIILLFQFTISTIIYNNDFLSTSKVVIDTMFSIMIFADIIFLFLTLSYNIDFSNIYTNISFIFIAILFRLTIFFDISVFSVPLVISAMIIGITTILAKKHLWHGKFNSDLSI